MNNSKIDWCDMSWNPVTGCLHGCTYCYARKIANRFGKKEKETGTNHWINEHIGEIYKAIKTHYPYGFDPTFHKNRLQEPASKKKGKTIFVCSMADLFGEWVPQSWIEEVFNACENAPQHRYLFLTKNPYRYRSALPLWKSYHAELKNMWFGTTITKNEDIHKVYALDSASKNINKFLSIEPLLGEVDLSEFFVENSIGWIIIGGQTGAGAKPPKTEWVEKLINQCRAANVPILLKDNLNWHEEIKEFPW